MSTDHECLENLVMNDDFTELQLANRQSLYIPDINQGAYTNGQLQFNTIQAVSQYWVPSQAYLEAPFKVTLTGTPSATNNLGIQDAAGDNHFHIQFKNTIYQLITGVLIQVAGAGSTTLVNEQNTLFFKQYIDMYVNNNLNWQSTYQPETLLVKPTLKNGSNNADVAILLGQNLLRNISFGVVTSTVSSVNYITSFQFTAHLNLSYIHSYFASLDYPCTNLNLQINFNYCKEIQGSNCIYNAFCCSNNTSAAPTNTVFTLTVGNSRATNCRIRYDSLEFTPTFAVELAKKTEGGASYSKISKFVVTDIFTSLNATASQINQVVLTQVVKPIRQWLLGFPQGVLTSNNSLNFTQGQVSNLNIEINSANYFNLDLTTEVLWKMLQSQFCGGGITNGTDGSLLNYNDQVNRDAVPNDSGAQAIYCIDFHRLRGKIGDQTVTATLKFNRTDGINALDWILLTEREQVCTMNYYSNSVSCLIGPNAASASK